MVVKDFPVKCQSCNEEIQEGMAFYKHPRLGFVCEDCPEFADGGIEASKGEENG